MAPKTAKAEVAHIRQTTQFTCCAASIASALCALGKQVTEDDVNKVLRASPMAGASWEAMLATVQYFGCRGTLVVPATPRMLKSWTDQGLPVVIAWNPEGRPWSHASVVYDVVEGPDGKLQIYVMDSNIPNPSETTRILDEDTFCQKWGEKVSESLIMRRPAMLVDREVTVSGRQVVASIRNANFREVYRLGFLHAFWMYNSREERVYGVKDYDIEDEPTVGEISWNKKTNTWQVWHAGDSRRALESFTASDAREGVKRALMTLQSHRKISGAISGATWVPLSGAEGSKYVSEDLLIWVTKQKVLERFKDPNLPSWADITNDGEKYLDAPDDSGERAWAAYQAEVRQGWFWNWKPVTRWVVMAHPRKTEHTFYAVFDNEREAQNLADKAVPSLLNKRRPRWLRTEEELNSDGYRFDVPVERNMSRRAETIARDFLAKQQTVEVRGPSAPKNRVTLKPEDLARLRPEKERKGPDVLLMDRRNRRPGPAPGNAYNRRDKSWRDKEAAADMSLMEFKKTVTSTLDGFVTWWGWHSKDDPSEFPSKMGYSDWVEHLKMYEDSK